MKKTVGILTFHRALNFGAILQAFALQRSISDLGCQCSIIDYLRRLRKEDPYRLFFFPRNRATLRHNLLTLLHLRSHLQVRAKFNRFLHDHLHLTEDSYDTLEDISRRCPSFDAYVTGSDQVWHPVQLRESHGRVFYLDFVRGLRIAYAPSFGVSQIPVEFQSQVSDLLRRFDSLSCREDTGCKLINELTGRKAEHVLDPTLLLPAAGYDSVAILPDEEQPYILLYAMQISEEIRQLAIKVRQHLNRPIVAVVPVYHNPGWFSFADRVVFDAGPAEFLGWIKQASFVCTNSFHGTAFSLIYRKDFLSVPHQSTNTRSYSLLQRFGLTARQLPDPGAFRPSDAGMIDYAKIEPQLAQAREFSLSYLRQALA